MVVLIVPQRVQVPNIWSQIPWRVWFLEPETSNIGYLDPLGIVPFSTRKSGTIKPNAIKNSLKAHYFAYFKLQVVSTYRLADPGRPLCSSSLGVEQFLPGCLERDGRDQFFEFRYARTLEVTCLKGPSIRLVGT